ncbi:MAG: hypothetical protein GTO63_20995 [Anaerolineae bacterium]|nr:hypothetical protein [Anaerolineae bacterium]NIN97276.1 hypothetical protein [Anaerolineae bacterium]NIQ80206.1 hypothetical protein [Anaerolineae bacterium]
MIEPSGVPRVVTFVVRFWREWSAAGVRWRGRIQDVQSGDAASFMNLDKMLQFLRGSGVMADDESLTQEQEE